MPTFTLHLPPELLTAVRQFAEKRAVSVTAALQTLITMGLKQQERLVLGGKTRAARMTPEERARRKPPETPGG